MLGSVLLWGRLMAAFSGLSFTLLFFSHFLPWFSWTISDSSGASEQQHFFLQGWGIIVAPCYSNGVNTAPCWNIRTWLSDLNNPSVRLSLEYENLLKGLWSAFGFSAVAFWISLAAVVCSAHAFNRIGGGCCRCCACCRCCCGCGPASMSDSARRARALCEAYGAVACLAVAFALATAAAAAAGSGVAQYIRNYNIVGLPIQTTQAGVGIAAFAAAVAALAIAAAVCFILALSGDTSSLAGARGAMLHDGPGDYTLVVGDASAARAGTVPLKAAAYAPVSFMQ